MFKPMRKLASSWYVDFAPCEWPLVQLFTLMEFNQHLLFGMVRGNVCLLKVYKEPMLCRRVSRPSIRSCCTSQSCIGFFREEVRSHWICAYWFFLFFGSSRLLTFLEYDCLPVYLCSWDSQYQMVWHRGRVQCSGSWLIGTQSWRPIQLLQPEVLLENCSHACRPAGVYP